MISPSSDFHDKIKDPSTYPQNLVLVFDDAYLSANDGDIEESGVEFDEYFCTAEDLSYGECPSSVMKATLINEEQILRTLKWGECRPYIGYRKSVADTSTTYIKYENIADQEDPNYICFTNAGGDQFCIMSYDGVVVVDSNPCYSFLVLLKSTGNSVCYAFGEGYAYKVEFDNETGQYSAPVAINPNRFMNTKMRSPKCVVWELGEATARGDIYDCTVTTNGTVSEWVYCPMGVFDIEKPANLSGDIVQIDEARDRMRLFDEDATEFLKAFNTANPTGATPSAWLTALETATGTTGTITFTDTATYIYNPTTACTLRQILAYLAENTKCVFLFDRDGRLTKYTVGSLQEEEVGVDRIEADTLTVAEYVTRPTTKIVNKNLSGLTYVSGSGDNGYYILGNPFVQNNSNISVSDVSFYPYAPLSCTVLEADPAVEVGDKVGIWFTEDEYRLFIDNFNRVFTDDDGNMFGEEIVAVPTPLMHRILSWNGVCTATYEAVGNPTRLVPSEVEQINYNANSANDTGNVINKIEAHGIEADWIKTGILSSPNGDYSLDMDTGSVEMKNASFQGGDISIETSSSTADKIALNYEGLYATGLTQILNRRVALSPYSLVADQTRYSDSTKQTILASSHGLLASQSVYASRTNYSGGTATTHQSAGANPDCVYALINDNSAVQVSRAELYSDRLVLFGSGNSVPARVRLDLTGLYFYDSSGNVTKSYLAT